MPRIAYENVKIISANSEVNSIEAGRDFLVDEIEKHPEFRLPYTWSYTLATYANGSGLARVIALDPNTFSFLYWFKTAIGTREIVRLAIYIAIALAIHYF